MNKERKLTGEMERRMKEEGKKKERRLNLTKIDTKSWWDREKEREKEEQSDSAIKMANKILSGDDMN